ncbi:MAG: saccharopine dehydrogenase-like NADP-dependent oxidoreductase, partial [Enterobacterales bacterium]
MKKVVVLGGYGNFGKRIVENLTSIEDITILIAGRNLNKSSALVANLDNASVAKLEPLVIDIFADDFKERLATLSPYLVIHTSGPFQGQDYRVPKACIECGAHYVDLADDRRFVCDIAELDNQAKDKGVLIVSGASSVPGLSSAVVERYQNQFSTIESINLAIAPGNKAERGLATVEAILSYTGHPLNVFKEGRWQDVYGWMDSKVNDFGGFVGKRHLANVDVPDLELFPSRYGVTQQVSFQAGLELSLLHKTMVGMAYLSKIGLVKNWAPLSKTIVSTSNVFLPFGSDKGAMEVLISGKGNDGNAKKVKWTLYAPKGNGPYIPTLSTIILARKLLS